MDTIIRETSFDEAGHIIATRIIAFVESAELANIMLPAIIHGMPHDPKYVQYEVCNVPA